MAALMMAEKEKHYAHHLTTTSYFKLDAACIPLWAAFGSHGGVYMVGSALPKFAPMEHGFYGDDELPPKQ